MRVLYIDTEGGYSYKIIGDAVKKYLPLTPGIEYKLANHKKTELRHIDGFQPDWCLTSTPLNNHSYIIKNQRFWFSVGWDLEGCYEWKRLRETDSKHFDVIATVDPIAKIELNKMNRKAIYLPLGFDPDVYRPIEVSNDYQSDVIIAGVMYNSRARWVKALEPIAKHIKIRTINCKHWEAKIINCRKFISDYFNDLVSVEELVKHYNGAKMIIIGHRDFAPNNDMKDIQPLAIGRVFQEAACKRLVLSDNSRPNLSDHFEIGKEIVVFQDEDDLRNKIMYYMTHEDEREQIALNGYHRAMQEHTYSHRLQYLCDQVEALIGV